MITVFDIIVTKNTCKMLQIFCHFILPVITTSIVDDSMITATSFSVPGYFHWTHPSVASKVLFCPNCCSTSLDSCLIPFQDLSYSIPSCCIKRAIPFWEFWENLTVPLSLQFYSGKHLIQAAFNISDDSVQVFKYTDGNLTIFPDNICDFQILVKIELQGNKIENLIELDCLHFLDYLDLGYNKIKTVRSSFFLNMTNLRYLCLSHNLITYLEPGAFRYQPRSLAYIYLDWNFLQTIDVSDVIMGYCSGVESFSGNHISKITNEFNWRRRDVDGGGFVNLTHNNLTHFPSPPEIGFEDIEALLKAAFRYNFSVENNPWSCDCNVYYYVLAASIASLHFNNLKFRCQSPAPLTGYSAENFQEDNNLLKYLICVVSLHEKCPAKCNCYSQPSETRLVVNCSSSDLSMIPTIVPDFDDLDIDLSHNMITTFKYLNFLNRTKRIDLSYNDITFVDPAVYLIEKLSFINLAYNKIIILQRSVQLKSPCNLWYGNISLAKCKCEMGWIKVWLERQSIEKCQMENVITCQQSDKNIDLLMLSESDICSSMQSNTVYWCFAIAAFILVLFALLYNNFKYEIKLLIRTVKLYLNCHKSSQVKSSEYEYDVYVSFNIENNDVSSWTIGTLNTFLENQGYKICLPPRDFDCGAIHVEELYKKITTSKAFVIVLSHDYERSQFQSIEWKHIWNLYMTDLVTTLTVINYDFLESTDTIDRNLKAFLRLGYSLSFDDFNKTLLHDIKDVIGSPSQHIVLP